MNLEKLLNAPVRGHSVTQFAEIIGLGRTRIYEEIKLGRIRVLKAGRRTIIPSTEVEAFFERLADAKKVEKGGQV